MQHTEKVIKTKMTYENCSCCLLAIERGVPLAFLSYIPLFDSGATAVTGTTAIMADKLRFAIWIKVIFSGFVRVVVPGEEVPQNARMRKILRPPTPFANVKD